MSAAPTPITPEAAAAFNAANAAFREGRFDAALDAATRAAQLAPDLAIAHVLKARALRRLGASFMTAAGLSNWVAADDGDYVAKAVAIAQDRQALMNLKRGLRAQLLARAGWDADRYAADFGTALRAMWRKTVTPP